MPEGICKPYNGNQDFSSLAESAGDIPYLDKKWETPLHNGNS